MAGKDLDLNPGARVQVPMLGDSKRVLPLSGSLLSLTCLPWLCGCMIKRRQVRILVSLPLVLADWGLQEDGDTG